MSNSRIIVRNLPETIKEEEIKNNFIKCGQITDIYMLTKNNKFRRTCFIGYKSVDEAVHACKYFNNTYIKNHKIIVEIINDNNIQDTNNNNSNGLSNSSNSLSNSSNGLSNGGVQNLSIEVDKLSSVHRIIFYSRKIRITGLGNLDEEEIINDINTNSKVNNYYKILSLNKIKNFYLILFKKGEKALEFYKNIKIICGRRILLNCFKEDSDSDNLSNKKQSHFNSLFFNFDSIIKSTTEMTKLSKDQLIDLKQNSLGAKISLMETNLVISTKAFLDKHNIFYEATNKDEKSTDEDNNIHNIYNITKNHNIHNGNGEEDSQNTQNNQNNIYNEEEDFQLKPSYKRSKTILIIRALDMLGVLDKIKSKGENNIFTSPSKCLTIIKFENEKDAWVNQKKLNLLKFKNEVVYCEFAPIKTKETKETKLFNNGGVNGGVDGDKINKSNSKLPKLAKLIIKNVPFQAEESDIYELFKTFLNVKSIKIPKKNDNGDARGFCFVTFGSSDEVDKAIKIFGISTHLFGRKLILERARS